MTASAPPARVLRTVLLVLAVPLLVLLLLGAAVCWRLDARARQEARTLALEYTRLAATPSRRPSHVEHPTPGTLAQALEPLLPELHGLAKTPEIRSLGLDLVECWDVTRGRQPVSALPSPCHERLEGLGPLMHRVLRASRTEEAGLTEELRLADTLGDIKGWFLEQMLRGLLSLAALEVRLQAESGQADSAWETCLDALALSRDLSHGSGQGGVLGTTHDYDVLFLPCATALSRASPSLARQAAVSLRHLREGLRPLSAALEESRILDSLRDLPRLLEAEELAGLPVTLPSARPAVALGGFTFGRRTVPVLEPLLMREAFLTRLEDQRRLASLVDLPVSLRMPRLEALKREEDESKNPQRAAVAWSTIQTAARVDRQRMEVDLLLALARVRTWRAEHGRWPSDLPPLDPEHPVLRPTSLQLHAGEGETLVIEPREEAVRELERFTDPEESDGAMMTFQVTAPP